MRGRSIATLVGGALVVAAAASPFFACNALTKIGDYDVDCQGCILGACKRQFARCQGDCTCLAGNACFQNCAIAGKPPAACSTECVPSGTSDPIAADMLQCVFENCVTLCFGQPANVPPGVDASLPVPVCDGGAIDSTTDSPGDAATCPGPNPTVHAPKCSSTQGPSMVEWNGHCIDTTEVTNAQYQTFLDAAPPSCLQPHECSWNVGYAPQPGDAATVGAPDLPVRFVNWCDAYAYCAWAGKRLCGRIGALGGSYDFGTTDFKNASVSEWYDACSATGVNNFFYGTSYVTGTCDDNHYDGTPGVDAGDKPIAVGSDASCHAPVASTPLDKVFDMIGNVAEWENSCGAASGPDDLCRYRGAGFLADAAEAQCDQTKAGNRSLTAAFLGFRCCAE